MTSFFQNKIMVATNTETESLEDALQIVKKEKMKMLLVSFEPTTFLTRKN